METVVLIAFVFLLLFIYGIFSQKLNALSISGPMFFLLMGIGLSCFEGVKNIGVSQEALGTIGQIALIAILFTDASNIAIKDFFRLYQTPVRLLLVGLPITMVVGAITAKAVFPTIETTLLVVMAFILSPTDAALGQEVVQSPKIRKVIREGINVESGLNDGLVLPPILICIALIQGKADDFGTSDITIYVLKQIFIAPVVGGLIGWLGSKLINWSVKKQFSDHFFQGISIVAISILSFVVAEHAGGNGYISAFVSGTFFNADSKRVLHRGQEFGEFLSQPLALFVFFILGAVVVPEFVQYVTWRVVLYAILSLTVLRMIPVLLSLMREKIELKEKVFIGWFGPRGIASVLYFFILYQAVPRNDDTNVVFATILLTVVMSVVLHGLSAVPYCRWMATKDSK